MIGMFYRLMIRDRRGTVAMITALAIFPLLFLAMGVPIDLARAVQLRSQMQNFDDAAAVAGMVDIANGATAQEACQMVYTMGADTVLAPGNNLSFGAGASTAPGTTCDVNPQTDTSTAPDSVTATANATLAMTFTAYLQKSITINTSATATGPQGFITICVTPTASGSSDLNQAFYYFRKPDGTIVNQDGTVINPADYPGLSTGPASNVPNGNGVELSAFLVDNASPTAHGPNVTNGYCNAAETQVKVTLKNGLGQRLGFEVVNVTGGQYPCYYGTHTTSMSCLSNGTNYAYDPTLLSAGSSSGNANGFENYYLNHGTPLLWTTNAYGSFIGEENIFYSTDYPADYETNNLNTSIPFGALTVASPAGLNPCYYQPPANGSLTPTLINGYGSASQGCLLSQAPANAVAKSYGAAPGATVTFAFKSPSQTNILVCLANDGTNKINGTAFAPAVVSGSNESYPYYYVTGTSSTSGVQQENMIIANSSTASPSLGSNVYQCPVNTIGNPYYPDPTCAELQGSTLSIGWNDMGGFESDNGTSPSDLSFSYSCQAPTSIGLTETALTQ